MVTNYNSVRIRKLKLADLKGTESHNQRVYRGTENHVDYTKSEHNETLYGASTGLRDAIIRRLNDTDVKVCNTGHNASVVAVEIVMSVTPTFFRKNAHKWGAYDQSRVDAWKAIAIKTLEKEYGDNLINAELHLDEATPHIHAIITPIVKKELKRRRTKEQMRCNEPACTYAKSTLAAKDMFNRKNLRRLQTITAAPLEKFGILRGIEGSKTKHCSTKTYWKELQKTLLATTQLEMPVLSFELGKKDFFESADKHLKNEQTKLNKAHRVFFTKTKAHADALERSARFFEEKYELERSKNAHIQKLCKEHGDIGKFIEFAKEQLFVMKKKLNGITQEAKQWKVKYEDASQKLRRAFERNSELEGKLRYSEHERHPLEGVIARRETHKKENGCGRSFS